MEVVGRYGIRMVEGWTVGDSSEGCRLKVIEPRDRERE